MQLRHLHTYDHRNRCYVPLPRESDLGRWVIPRDAKGLFKTHCDNTFGGQVWFNVLNQMGGCPAEFVEAYDAVISQRLEVAW